MSKYVMALDAGTTSNRCIIFNEKGENVQCSTKRIYSILSKNQVGLNMMQMKIWSFTRV